MGRDRAAYMREYRARKAGTAAADDIYDPVIAQAASARIRELEEEVRHLKAELAKRPPSPYTVVERLRSGDPTDRFDTQPVRAVPKVTTVRRAASSHAHIAKR